MDVQRSATSVVRKLSKAGYIAYFAGGWVRDHLLKRSSSDIDIATNAPPEVILDLFPHTILVGLSFGVVVVIFEGYQFEVATFRKDIGYLNGRKPEQIELSTPQEDALRRDFTINGMFYDPLAEEIYDFVGGASDLKKGVIRTIGSPYERFVEDRLRMIRAIRFACRFEFFIEADTQDAIAENANTLFPAVAMERIWQELTKMSMMPNFNHALIEMHRLRLLPVIFPELEHVHLHEMKRRVSVFTFYPNNSPTVLYLLALFPEASVEKLIGICQNLRVSNRDMALVKLAMHCKTLVESHQEVDDVSWVHFYAKSDAQCVLLVDAALRPAEKQGILLENHYLRQKSFHEHILRVIHRNPLVTSARLKEQGIPEGKLLGVLLKEAERIAIGKDLSTANSALEELQKSTFWPKND
ncbi:MAG: CCA tRNA nucleotidyltransferase [Parachlamydiaceae bacterium]|nr:CCA tRNA nucleotidyltransferase [Parachlamydiaceae bacterium]